MIFRDSTRVESLKITQAGINKAVQQSPHADEIKNIAQAIGRKGPEYIEGLIRNPWGKPELRVSFILSSMLIINISGLSFFFPHGFLINPSMYSGPLRPIACAIFFISSA